MRILSRLFRRAPFRRSEGWDFGAQEVRMAALCGCSLNQIRLETYTFTPLAVSESPLPAIAKKRAACRSTALPAAQTVLEMLPYRPSENGPADAFSHTPDAGETADYTEIQLAGLGLPDNIVSDHQLLGTGVPGQTPQLLIAAAREEAAAAHLQTAARLGVKPDYLDIDILALANACLFARSRLPQRLDEAVLQLAPEQIQLLVFDARGLRHLAAAPLPNQETAFPSSEAVFQTALLDTACNEALRLIRQYLNSGKADTPPQRIALTGSLAAAAESVLAAAGLNAVCRHPIHALAPDIPPHEAAQLGTAFGLALKPFIGQTVRSR